MNDQDYIIEVRQELYHRWLTNCETPSMPATDNTILYYKNYGYSVDQTVEELLKLPSETI